MADFQNDDLEYVDDYFDMTDFDDEPFSEGATPKSSSDDPFDSDFEDDFEMGKSKSDTTALEARNGKDIQGIPWERLNFTRDKYRETRLKQYKNYENLPSSREELEKDPHLFDVQCPPRHDLSVSDGFSRTHGPPHNLRGRDCVCFPRLPLSCGSFRISGSCYAWVLNFVALWLSRLVNLEIEIYREKLRNLLWATSKHDVYLMQNYSVMHWSAMQKKSKEVLNVAKPIVPTVKCPESLSQPLSRVQISTMSVKDNLLVAGGFHGELICKYLNQAGVAFSTKVTTEENAITNAVDIFSSPGGSKRVITANNDAQVRIFDVVNYACLNRFCFPWSVNNTSVSPDGKLVAVLGDSADCFVADAQSGKVVNALKGHLDYSFSSAWHPDGRILATGNQDTTCRLWDIRNTSLSLEVLKGRMGAIRAVKFSSDGRFMAMAEPADFVHIFDTNSNYEKGQEIDLFGEIAGISFSPDTEALFVGVADRTYGSVLEFNRRRHNRYLEAMF
ncbi:hypothetical protein Ancab_036357 [Ancistrocladus abbreviatus]